MRHQTPSRAELLELLRQALRWDDALMRDDPEQIEPDWKADAREALGISRQPEVGKETTCGSEADR